MPDWAHNSLLHAYSTATGLAPLIGGAILWRVCRWLRVEQVGFLRCWWAFFVAWVASTLFGACVLLTLDTVFDTPRSAGTALLAVGLGLHLLLVPLVVHGGFRRVITAHVLTLLIYTTLIAGITIPLVTHQRSKARLARLLSNFRQVGVGFQQAANNMRGSMLPEAFYDAEGNALLSWRVAILPYVGEGELYDQFNLEEPWDSPHNLKLLPQIPEVFKPQGMSVGPGMTCLQVFVQTWSGAGDEAGANGLAIFGPRSAGQRRGEHRPRMSSMRDTASDTLLIVEAAEPVAWTKPQDMNYGPGLPLPKLGGQISGQFLAQFVDGHVEAIPLDVAEAELRAMITGRATSKSGK